LGFPTANLHLRRKLLLPADGVYAVIAESAGRRHAGVMNIGVRPTFAGRRRTVEVHLLDFAGDLYRHWLVVRLIERLRGEAAFAGPEALRAAIAADVARARRVLAGGARLAPGGRAAPGRAPRRADGAGRRRGHAAGSLRGLVTRRRHPLAGEAADRRGSGARRWHPAQACASAPRRGAGDGLRAAAAARDGRARTPPAHRPLRGRCG